MSALAELQRRFLAALAGADDPSLNAVIAAHAPGEQQRLQVYRNNRRCNLRNALRIAYATIERLVGREFFDWMADQFIDAHASESGNLDDYGSEFPDFISQFPAAASLPYLGDVARLEAVIDAVMAAPDVRNEEGAILPVAQLFESAYPVQRIWQVNQPGWQGDDTVALDEGGVLLLVQRIAGPGAAGRRFDLHLQVLSAEQFQTLQAAAATLSCEATI